MSTKHEKQMPAESRASYGGYPFEVIVQRLRLIQLVAVVMQILTLYMDHDRVGNIRMLIPLALLLLNIAHTGRRWFYAVDGRSDFRRLNEEHNPGLKAQYAFGLVGSVVLAMLSHFMLGALPSTLSSLIYHLADYASILSAGLCTAAEIFEGTRGRNHRSF